MIAQEQVEEQDPGEPKQNSQTPRRRPFWLWIGDGGGKRRQRAEQTPADDDSCQRRGQREWQSQDGDGAGARDDAGRVRGVKGTV